MLNPPRELVNKNEPQKEFYKKFSDPPTKPNLITGSNHRQLFVNFMLFYLLIE